MFERSVVFEGAKTAIGCSLRPVVLRGLNLTGKKPVHGALGQNLLAVCAGNIAVR